MKNRYQEILKLCSDKVVSVEELANHFNVSASTIRRDLTVMEDKGMIIRVYGGAKANSDQVAEPNIDYKELFMTKEKESIAKMAASLVNDGDIIYVDAGTTTSKIIKYITARDILVVTQGTSCIQACLEKGFKCYVAGGYLKERTGIIVGNETINKIASMNYNIAFIGANAIHPYTGITTTDELEASMKSAAIDRSLKAFICADSSKFNKLSLIKFCDLKDANIITDELIEDFAYDKLASVITVK